MKTKKKSVIAKKSPARKNAKIAGKKTPKTTKKTPHRVETAVAPAKPRPVPQDPAYLQAVQTFQDAVRHMQERKYERAHALFQKVAAGSAADLRERAAVYLNTCKQRMEQASSSFRNPEERYDYAVSLMNIGEHLSAREHLEKILKQAPQADYAWYGLALVDCQCGRVEDALRALKEAVRLNTANRLQARNETDFNNMADDPRFTELLYPDDAPAS